MGLTGRVHSMAREEGGTTALARRHARRRQRSASAGEGGRGRPTRLGGPKGRVGQLVAGPIGLEAGKKSFRNKN
jgi:hypothetical protein